MSRITKGLATAATAAVALAGFTACGSAQLAMAPHTATRPVWNGYGTPTAPAGVMMLCPASDAGNAARLADGTLVECVIDGRQYVWNAVSSR